MPSQKKLKPNSIRFKCKTFFPWRKILRNLVLVLMMIAIFCFLWFVVQTTKPSSAPIKNVRIIASFEHLERKELQRLVIPYLHNGFYYCNTFALKRKLLELPWVFAVTIERIWPDGMLVNVVEQTSVAKWGNLALFNPDGVMFFPLSASFPGQLPILFGPQDRAAEIFQQYQHISQLLVPLKLSLRQLVLSPQHYWIMKLNSGTELYLSEALLLPQLQLFVELYPRVVAKHLRAPQSIDLRYNNGLAIKW